MTSVLSLVGPGISPWGSNAFGKGPITLSFADSMDGSFARLGSISETGSCLLATTTCFCQVYFQPAAVQSIKGPDPNNTANATSSRAQLRHMAHSTNSAESETLN